jgi:hypothetical protein
MVLDMGRQGGVREGRWTVAAHRPFLVELRQEHQRQSAPEPITSVANAARATAAFMTRWFQRNTVHLLVGE